MTQLQKVIKYLAIALAVFLIAGIVSGVLGALASISYLYGTRNGEAGGEFISDGMTKSLEIEIGAAELIIKKGDSLRAESYSKYIICRQSGDEMIIKEKNHGLFSKSDKNSVTVYIPEGFVFDSAQIEAGAGKVSIEALSAENLELDLGAGEMTIDTISAARSAEIEIGAGKMTIKDGSLANLELDLGMGKLDLTAALEGNSNVDFGIGEARLHLIGGEEDYSIKLDKGIGAATVNGRNLSDNETYGSGKSSIVLDGGIGSIEVDFKAQESEIEKNGAL